MGLFRTEKTVAIDGPAGSGKSTVSRLVADRLGFVYFDTGAMYRALTLKVMRKNVDLGDEEKIIELSSDLDLELLPSDRPEKPIRVILDDEDVTEEIRKMEVTNNVKYVARLGPVREYMVKLQRRMVADMDGAVMEGRDIGTVVLPRARYKFYLDASFEERVHRRLAELRAKGHPVTRAEVVDDLKQRDHTDKTRKAGPLKKARDAVFIDTTDLSIEQVVMKIVQYIKKDNPSPLPRNPVTGHKETSRIIGNVLYCLSRGTFEVLIRILFNIRVFGRENIPEPPFILASNHSSILDPPLVGLACKKYNVDFMAKQELFDTPVVGAWTRRVRCIEVRRGQNSSRSLKEAIKRLKKGHVVGIFPEGTRSVDGELQDAKRGTGFLIDKANVPVVPVYIEGSVKAFPKGQGIRMGTRINVFIGAPVFPRDFLLETDSGKRDYDAVSNLVMERISRLSESEGGRE
ncbi:MAG: (d)CMP kinase [Candidatus Omnitrophota bacterium]|nr:(d)CMP kinase [Candidatus Omnitrophota bacterium]